MNRPGRARMSLWAWLPDALQRALAGREQEPLEEGASRPGPERYGTCDPRDAALGKLPWSAPLAAAALFAVYALSRWGRFGAGFKLVGPLVAVLLVPGLVHLTEIVTNVRFRELSARWDQLAGWQRGVLGTGIVVVAGMVILTLAFAFAVQRGT
jgi:hypothetical protein